MFIEFVFPIMLLLATLFCTLATGFILIFAIVVMPGISTLQNREFLRAFQVIDQVIQKNQPLFVLIWVGSAVCLFVATTLGVGLVVGVPRILLIVAVIAYISGVQLPTITINIPLNNRLQMLNLDTLEESSLVTERQHFEARWNRWNGIRTAFASLTSILLLVLMGLM
ncbi:MAG: DUF1772 domain-containing protein [Chloroflexota bacterium]